MEAVDEDHGSAHVEAALALGLPRLVGCTLLDPDDPAAGVAFVAADVVDNGAGGVHASALSVAAELAGYLAVAPTLGPGEHAVTHSSSTRLFGAAVLGQRVVARGAIVRRTRRLAFVSVLLEVEGTSIADVSLVKSVVRAGKGRATNDASCV